LEIPNAEVFKNALLNAEKEDGTISNTKLAIELLPYCIKSHPFGTIAVRQALDALDWEDYKKLLEALGDLLKEMGETEKKSEKPSE